MAAHSVAVLGAGGVGKTCLILRFTRDTWDSDYIPTIQDYFEKGVVQDGVEYTLKIIDTAGQDEMQAITDIGIKDSEACVIVYSVTSQVSFNEAEKYRNKVIQFSPQNQSRLVLAGNKCDLPDRAVTKAAGEELAQKWGCEFFETSAKENLNISCLFEAALRTIVPKATGEPLPDNKSGAKRGKKKGNTTESEPSPGCCDVA
jgi:small GTP-binding protein